jgi:glucokinase
MYADPRRFVKEAAKSRHKVSGWDEIALRAGEGEVFFAKMVEQMADYIALGCTSLINLFEPQVIIISGELNKNGAMLIKLIQERVDRMRINRAVRSVEILTSDTDKSHGVMAAATVVFSHYLSSPIR